MPNFILYKIAKFLSLILPLKISYLLAVVLADLHFFFSKKDRLAVMDNLKVILPHEKNIYFLSKMVFRNFAKYLVDFFRLSKLKKINLESFVSIEGLNYIDEALKKGKGVIGLTAHIGNWELGGVVTAILGYPLVAVALPHQDSRVNNFFNHQREIHGVKVLPLGNAASECVGALKENKIVALLGDRDFTQSGIVLDFFGKSALVPRGPAVFSLLTGAPIIPGFMLRKKDNTYKLIFEKPIESSLSQGKDREAQISTLIKKYLLIIESYIKKDPTQWLMFRRFWIK